MRNRFSKGLISTLVITLLMGTIALPANLKQTWPDNAFFNFFKNPKITLGLDLQGGTQLDYRIDLKNVKEKNNDEDPDNDVLVKDIVEGVRTTIERRVNGLGVSEPQIYLSNVGDEQHIVVELAGIKDIEEAKKIVGKTIQLEFKEQKETIDKSEKERIEKEANETLNKIKAKPDSFVSIGESVRTSDKKVDFRMNKESYLDQLPNHYKEILPNLKAGEFYADVIEGSDGYVISEGGNLSEKKGLFLVQLIESGKKDRTLKKELSIEEAAKELNVEVVNEDGLTFDALPTSLQEKFDDIKEKKINASNVLEIDNTYRSYQLVNTTKGEEKVKASHILIAYAGATRADDTVTRTKEEAKKEAERLAEEAKANPEKFAELAKEFSDGPSASKGGDLGFFGRGQMAKPFEDAAFPELIGEITDVVETEFGYHIIYITDKKKADTTYDLLFIAVEKTDENKEKLTTLVEKMNGYEVVESQDSFKYNEIFYDLTPDPWKSTGLDGSNFKFATVSYNQIGTPQVSIEFDAEGAKMFEEITDRLTNKPLAIFVGGKLISAPNVNQKITGGSAVITGQYTPQEALQLANDLNTGAIDAPILLTGQYTISASLGESALQVSLWAGVIGLIVLAIYMVLYYRLMGLLAVIALLIYSVITLFILKITGIVMTLAGIAGIILSIGMAVDANILIFERTKEELNGGKSYASALSAGFERAWSSIHDSNISSLITCAILWGFGNSIIRGFALMLAIGILVSMFTAVVVTRQLMMTLTGTKLSKNKFLLGAGK